MESTTALSSAAQAAESPLGETQGETPVATLKEQDDACVMRPWSGEPIVLVNGKDVRVRDEDGNEYIDFTSGYFVNQAGHCHPKVVAAATAQLQKITQVSGKHATPPAIELAKKLVERAPPGMSKVFMATGGSEANEFAFKMARQATGRKSVAALENGYHGLSLGVLPACSSEKYRKTAGIPVGEHTYFTPNAYCYRCPHQNSCETQCLDQTEALMDQKPDTAALIAEPMQAVGGLIPPQKWWDRLDAMRLKRGVLLILDEVQTGVGRTGTMFAAEHYGLEPDIISAGKGLSGAVGSLAAVLATDAVSNPFYAGTTPTSAGNAVSAAAGCALIDAIESEGMMINATKMGEYMSQALWELGDPWIGDVRFKGLLGGVELVSDRGTRAVLPGEVVAKVAEHMQKSGILLTISGLHGNFLRLQPPLSIGASEIDTMISALDNALKSVRATIV